MTEPNMSRAEADAAIETKTAPRVTLDGIKGRIARTEYINPHGSTLTVCLMELDNGFWVVGHSAAAAKANFDPAIGQRLAFDDCIRQCWALFGFNLREALANQ